MNKVGDFMAKSKATEIKEDLLLQLEKQDKTGKFYTDLVEDYIYFFTIKNKLKKDIKDKGIRISYVNGNGILTERQNESILNLTKINSQMLKILSDLDLQKPLVQPGDPDDLL